MADDLKPETSCDEIESVEENSNEIYTGHDSSPRKDKKEKRLLLKQDLSIVLLLSGCYWFAYLVSISTTVTQRSHLSLYRIAHLSEMLA